MPFDFNNKRDEINNAHGTIVLPLTDLTMTKLALGDTTNNIGQAETYYTDTNVNTANSDMFTNYAPNYFSVPTGETSLYFDNTFAGDPMPLNNNDSSLINSGGFCGTCKPAALGDYINHTSINSSVDGAFAIAGIDSGDVCVSVFQTDPNTLTPTLATATTPLYLGIGMGGNDNDIRIYAHPNLNYNSDTRIILVTVNDWTIPRIYLFMLGWDYVTNSLFVITNTILTAGGATNLIDYTGKHDMFYLPTSQNFLTLLTNGRLCETYVDGPSSTLSVTTIISNITAVAYDEVNENIVTTDTNGDVISYSTSINTSPISSVGSAVLTRVFDGCYNNTVDTTGYYFCAIDSVTSELVSYRFEVDSGGNITASTSYATTVSTIYDWRQVEVQGFNVINVGLGPTINPPNAIARVVCDSSTLRPTYDEYLNTNALDFMLMKHPTFSTASINSNPAAGSNHLISIDTSSTITTHSKNFLNTVESETSTITISSLNQYIVYLGYFYSNVLGDPTYLYLAVPSNLSVSFDPNGGLGGSTGGYFLYFSYRG
jgi:hypothetical protein